MDPSALQSQERLGVHETQVILIQELPVHDDPHEVVGRPVPMSEDIVKEERREHVSNSSLQWPRFREDYGVSVPVYLQCAARPLNVAVLVGIGERTITHFAGVPTPGVVVEHKSTIMCVDESRNALRRRLSNARDVIAKPADSTEHHAGRKNGASNERASGDEQFALWGWRMTAREFVQVGYEHEKLVDTHWPIKDRPDNESVSRPNASFCCERPHHR